MAAQWYQNHLGDATRVLLITNDRENKRKATEEGIIAETGRLTTIIHTHYISFYSLLVVHVCLSWISIVLLLALSDTLMALAVFPQL